MRISSLRKAAIVGFLFSLIIFVSIFVTFSKVIYDIPDSDEIVNRLRVSQLKLTSEIFDRKNKKIGEYSTEQRYYKNINQIPPKVIDAFLSAEDESFYSHIGIDFMAIARAVLYNAKNLKYQQGASTITQQLARMLFLNNEKSLRRKISEALVAIEIENKIPKSKILEIYLNHIYLGNGSYGVEAAARNYFRKPISKLTLGEAALLAALPKAPSRLAPHRNYRQAMQRQKWVLNQMLNNGQISRKDFNFWNNKKIKVYRKRHKTKAAPYYVDLLTKEIRKRLISLSALGDGLKIYTNLDRKLQIEAKSLTNSLYEKFSKSTKVRKDKIEHALITIANENGKIIAMQGGSSYSKTQYNRSLYTKRDLGHLLIPIISAMGLDEGLTLSSDLSMASTIEIPADTSTAPSTTTLYDILTQPNTEGMSSLLFSINMSAVSAKLKTLNIYNEIDSGYFTSRATPLNTARVFSLLANQGKLITGSHINAINSFDNKTIYKFNTPNGIQAVDKSSAYMVLKTLQNKPSQYKPKNNLGLYQSFSSSHHDYWQVAVSPKYTTVLWTGAETGKQTLFSSPDEKKEFEVFCQRAFANYLSSIKDPSQFNIPEGIVFKNLILSNHGQTVFIPTRRI